MIPLIRNVPLSSGGDEALCAPFAASSNAALGTDGAMLPEAHCSGGNRERLSLSGRSDWKASRWLLDHSAIQSVALCGMTTCTEDPVGVSRVAVNLRAGSASFSGLKRCGSVWACPTCAARIWAERRDELETIVGAACAQDYTVGMVTLTLRHNRDQQLDALLSALTVGWRRSQQQRGVREAAEALGIVGFVRRTEITHGYRNGWHPHLHILVFAKNGQGLGAKRRWDDWSRAIRSVWQDSAVKEDLKAPSNVRGVDLKVFEFRGNFRENAELVTSHYLTKGGTFVGAAAEFTDADEKRAKNGNRTSWELLAEAMDGRSSAIARWNYYETATSGKRAWAVSKSLRKMVEDYEPEVEPEVEPLEVGSIRVAGWRAIVRDRRDAGEILTVVEKAWEKELARGSGEDLALQAASLALEDKLREWDLQRWFVPPLKSLFASTI